jgi:Ser/Thr protein kinase RdoA (MazF antagonist)
MYEQYIPHVLKKYGIVYDTINSVQKGYRNESYAVTLPHGEIVNVIVFKNEPSILEKIHRADHASQLLSDTLPVRVRHDSRLLKVGNNTYAGVYTYLPGATVPWEALTKKHIKLMGQAMADMHRIWRRESPYDDYTIKDELTPLVTRMKNYFSDVSVQQAMLSKLDSTIDSGIFLYLQKLITHIAQLPGQQIIHMDMVRGNVLFGEATDEKWRIDNVSIAGVIDFEKTTIGHPLFDIARTLAFLIVDSPKPEAKIYNYFLDSGYVKRGNGSLPDAKLLTELIKLFLLHDFYKFLKHTPYESLRDNYHYTRTYAKLKDYGMINPKS